ncbi:hypothetical protein RJ639_036677 [Escallonia herrerae]|uniref:Uncharacterized protein n=1 Tax=Escallonia herrerae TaxID=1293975 RepID=A0AA88WQ47_9ASTE|nr:hypothetical protein RJ639_036677 [Escallonia herrerae]
MPHRSPSPSPSLTQPTVGRHPLRSATPPTATGTPPSSVKHKSAKTYGELAQETGLPNVYVAQILKCQALLSPEAACMLRALPGLPEDLVLEMMEPPRRSYDPLLIQDPAIYR